MFRTVCFLALAAYVAAQYNSDPRNAAILSESRYLNGDGKFGSAYKQEDGVEFKEESDPDGTRRGTYSYVDPNGQRKTVSYTAGKNGFQATGDHLPGGGNPQPPTPGYTPLPQYNPPPPSQYQQPQYRPQQQQYTAPPQQYTAPTQQYKAPPQQYRQQQYSAPVQEYRPQPQPQYQPQQQYQSQPQQPIRYTSTTPAPHRFFPPGKLSLNRSPDGYSYTFNKA